MTPETQERALVARWAILRAGRLTLDYFEQGVTAETKADATPVTIADRQAEELLRDAFRKHFPKDGFLGEEYGEEKGTSGYKWIIDPIDATKNFVRGIPIFANLVGLEFEGKMVAGFANIPAQSRLYHAVVGGGAFCNDRPIRVSSIQELEGSQIIYSSVDWFERAGTTGFFLDVVRTADRTRGFGDYYGFTLVAEGAAEAMLEPAINPWDIACFQPIIEEAGGVFTDWEGNPTVYGCGALVANPAIHAQLLDRYRAHLADKSR
ncbi:MAG: inositol monophosphatase family protein [Planctomycetota bacterium]